MSSGSSGGNGGSGGGGDGSSTTGAAGSVNTGGGGGGSNGTAGQIGGSGIVIIAYPDSNPAATLTNLTYTQPTRSGYRVYSITASSAGTITF